jgi:hypothetical protein
MAVSPGVGMKWKSPRICGGSWTKELKGMVGANEHGRGKRIRCTGSFFLKNANRWS